MSKAIRQRNDKVSAAVRTIAWKAQQRLHKRLYRLIERGKPSNQAATAVCANWRASCGRSPTRRCCWRIERIRMTMTL